MPGTVLLLVTVAAKSTCGVKAMLLVTELFAKLVSVTPLGGATETVLTRLPVALALNVPLIVNVSDWPFAKETPLHAPVLLL